MRTGIAGDIARQLGRTYSVEDVQRVVKTGVRRLLGSGGLTFVLLDHEMCYYADEDSMSPLWKGQRFPVAECVSGWAMVNRRSVVVGDIRRDSRVPAQAYRPTFVRSMIMSPMVTPAPLGAVGAYWARVQWFSHFQVEALEEVSDLAATALSRFPEGLPDPGFPLQGAQGWQVRPAARRGFAV